jgi:hypothetical protein
VAKNHTPSPKCGCKNKTQYPSEAVALTVAARRAELARLPISVYLCPGTSCWHLTSRGFRPASLKSRARILAWHIDRRRALRRDDLLSIVDLRTGGSWEASQGKKLNEILGKFRKLGLVTGGYRTIGDPVIRVADHHGLVRVMKVGLDQFEMERERQVN